MRRKLCSETPLATREGTSDSSVRNTVWFFQSCHGAANLMFSLPNLHSLASTCIQDKHFIYFIMLLLDVYVLIINVYINILSLPRAFSWFWMRAVFMSDSLDILVGLASDLTVGHVGIWSDITTSVLAWCICGSNQKGRIWLVLRLVTIYLITYIFNKVSIFCERIEIN